MFNRKNAAKYLMPYLYKIIVHRINIKLKKSYRNNIIYTID